MTHTDHSNETDMSTNPAENINGATTMNLNGADMNTVTANATDVNTDWTLSLKRDQYGRIQKSDDNVRRIFEAHPYFKGHLAYDTCTTSYLVSSELHARLGYGKSKYAWCDYSDDHARALRLNLLPELADLCPGKETTHEALTQACRANDIHYTRDTLKRTPVDPAVNLVPFFMKALGIEGKLAEIYSVKWLRALVARMLHPGVKMHNVLTLKGDGGCGKSEFFEIMAGRSATGDPLVEDGIPVPTDPSHPENLEVMHGAWIVELAELRGFGKASVDDFKSFCSKTSDKWRSPYARTAKRRNRSFVTVITTNEAQFLRDATGNRRFWILEAKKLDKNWLIANREQMLAKAIQELEELCAKYNCTLDTLPTESYAWWLSPEEEALSAANHEDYYVVAPGEDSVIQYMAKAPEGEYITRDDLVKVMSRVNGRLSNAKLSKIAKDCGFDQVRIRIGGTQLRVWCKGEPTKHYRGDF